jgi:hypothetical protein
VVLQREGTQGHRYWWGDELTEERRKLQSAERDTL